MPEGLASGRSSVYANPRGEGPKRPNRVVRGGSWNDHARNVRAAYRNANHRENRNHNLGFRVARARVGAGWPRLDPIFILPELCLSAKSTGGPVRAYLVVDAPQRACRPFRLICRLRLAGSRAAPMTGSGKLATWQSCHRIYPNDERSPTLLPPW